MKKLYLVIFVFAAVVIVLSLDNLVEEMPEVKLTEHDQVIMYSITGCENCENKRRELRTAQIPFVEYVVDLDIQGGREFGEKLESAGFTIGKVGYPSFDVKGTLIPNNPPLLQIKKHL